MLLKIGISGKRNILTTEKGSVKKQIEEYINKFLEKHNATFFIGYTGLAAGADTLFAEVVAEVFKQPLYVVLPFAQEEFEKDFTNNEDLVALRTFISKAEKVEFISMDKPTDAERGKGYFEVGKNIVDNCSEMIFVWDGSKPAGRGGTSEIIGYYSEKKNVVAINFIRSAVVHPDELDEKINREYEASNSKAIVNRNKYRNIAASVIAMGWLAALLFAIELAFHMATVSKFAEIACVALELLLVFLVYVLILVAKKKDFHGQYIEQRKKAEILRLLRSFYHSGVEVRISELEPEKHADTNAIVKEIDKTISSGSSYRSAWYASYDLKNLINGQLQYHKGRIKRIGHVDEWFETMKTTTAVIFIANIIVHLIAVLSGYYIYPYKFIIFASISMPATYAGIEGILHFKEWKLMKKHSETAITGLKECLHLLPVVSESGNKEVFNSQAAVLDNVSSIMLSDNRNWQVILESKHNYQFII